MMGVNFTRHCRMQRRSEKGGRIKFRSLIRRYELSSFHDDVIKWEHFPRYWPFVRGIHRSPVNSPHKGQWRRALMFSLICVWINGWVNNRKAGDLRRYRGHYGVNVICKSTSMIRNNNEYHKWTKIMSVGGSIKQRMFLNWPQLLQCAT